MTQTPQQTHQEPPNPKKRARGPLGPSIRGKRTRPTSNRTQDRYKPSEQNEQEPQHRPVRSNRGNRGKPSSKMAYTPQLEAQTPGNDQRPPTPTRAQQPRQPRQTHEQPRQRRRMPPNPGENAPPRMCPTKTQNPRAGTPTNPTGRGKTISNHAQDRSNRGKRAGNHAYTSRGTKSKGKATRSHHI